MSFFQIIIYVFVFFSQLSCESVGEDKASTNLNETSNTNVTLSSIISSAQSRRIDFLLISDSNTVFKGFGWDSGLQYALAKNYQMYATGIITAKENIGRGAGIGYFYNAGDILDASATGAPAELDSYMDGNLTSQNYAYLLEGKFTQGHGLFASSPGNDDPLDVLNANIRYHYSYGTFPTGQGKFRPGIRNESTPFKNIITDKWIQTNVGKYGVSWGSIDTEGKQESKITTRFANSGISNGAQAPYMAYFSRLELPERNAGFSLTTMYFKGGASMYQMANAFKKAHDNTIWLNLFEARRLQLSVEQDPIVIIIVNSGFNDRNETNSSIGPGKYTDGDSGEAYADNLTSLIERVESVWNDNFENGELYWVILPSHPMDSLNEKISSYRSSLKSFSRSNLFVVDMVEFIDPAILTEQNMYDGPGAKSVHLTQSGYEYVSSLIIENILLE